MQSNTVKAGVGALLVAAAVVLFIVLSGGEGGSNDTTAEKSAASGTSGKEPATPSIPTIVVKDGKPVGGVRELDYTEGDQIRFKVDSDVSDEVHVHGYDLMKDVKAGGSVAFDFKADIEGIFEAELESRKEQIIEFRVNP
jgi:hypothetical protein